MLCAAGLAVSALFLSSKRTSQQIARANSVYSAANKICYTVVQLDNSIDLCNIVQCKAYVLANKCVAQAGNTLCHIARFPATVTTRNVSNDHSTTIP